MKPTRRTAASLLAASLLLATLAAGPAGATVVRMETLLGTFDIDLFEDATPLTVANFLEYMNAGDYDGSIVHRSALTQLGAPFVIQGGGFFLDGDAIAEIPELDPVMNEPGISNLRGTIAMAKLSGGPDPENSATSQWFFNLGDNSFLDGQNGGFTVFGEVLGDGMDVVDAIAGLQRWNASLLNPALDEIPLIDYSGVGPITGDLVLVTSVTLVPEPGTALLLGGALAGLALRRRR